jgi:GNAT superfamily N-acetyltransferase
MIIREAQPADIPALHRIRMRVKENALSNPLLVTEKDYNTFLLEPNKGWVAIDNEVITGFAIVDVESANLWALFVDPEHECKGAGKLLHTAMINWYFSLHHRMLWLSTAPGTRAERFYGINGWTKTGLLPNGEMRFEMQSPKDHQQ